MIGEALASCTLQRDESAGAVIDADRDTIRVAEIEFGQIAVQMVFGAMLVNALHAALEDRIVAFHGVCVDGAANIFVLGMRDEIVRGEIWPRRR